MIHIMETLPHEILRYYIGDIYDCVALRRTCRRLRHFTVALPLVWKTWSGHPMDKNCTDGIASLGVCVGAQLLPVIQFTNDRGHMKNYLSVSILVGAEFTLWLCCINPARISPEISKIAATGYTYRVATGARTAVYICTAELAAHMYVPTAGYFDIFW